MITGTHLILYSKKPETDKRFFRDVLQLTNVDVGHGWLIFGLPPAEIAVHPHSDNNLHEIYLMTNDVNDFVTQMKEKKISCTKVKDQGWGLLTHITLPGGGKLGVYQPKHKSPKPMKVKKK